MTSPTAQRPAAPQAPAPPNGQAPAGEAPKAPRAKSDKRWVSIQVSAEQRKGLSEMARIAGGAARDFYTSLLIPAIDKALADFAANKDVVSARAKAQAAKTAAEKAQEIAKKAQEELAKVEAASKS